MVKFCEQLKILMDHCFPSFHAFWCLQRPTFHVASRSFHDTVCCREFVETQGGFSRKSREGVSLNLKSSSQMKIVGPCENNIGPGKKRNDEYVKYFSLEQFCLPLFKPVLYWLSINCRFRTKRERFLVIHVCFLCLNTLLFFLPLLIFYSVTSQYLAAKFTKTVLFWTLYLCTTLH